MDSNCQHLPRTLHSFKKSLVCKKCGKNIISKIPSFVLYFMGYGLGEFLDSYLNKHVTAALISFFIYLFTAIIGFCLIQLVINPLIGYKEFYPFRDV